MSKGKVLIGAPVHPVLTEGLAAIGYEPLLHEKITRAEAELLLPACAGIITSTRLLLNRQALDAAPNLRWIGRMGSGMEVIDVPYAASKGVACFSSPGGNCNAVGEHALGMLLCLNRQIAVSSRQIGEGLWLREENRGTELEGKTIGIIGFGHTGRAFAHKLQGMDMRILTYDKYDSGSMPDYVSACASLEPLFREAEIISFHVPIQEDTRHYFNVTFLRQMQQRFTLINTSRGEVVDIGAVMQGLESGRIRGACLDVWEEEPLEKMGSSQLNYLEMMIKRTDTIITPHIAGYTHEALYKMSRILLDKIIIMK